MPYSDGLFRYAHFPSTRGTNLIHKFRLQELTSLLQLNDPEDLKFYVDGSDSNPRHSALLIRYIFNSFEHTTELKCSPDRKFVVFDPSFRVVNRPNKKIYMLFGKNPNGPNAPQEWSFRGWCIGWDEVIKSTTPQVIESTTPQVIESTSRPDGDLCVICMEKPRNAVFVHGGTSHFSCCLTCARHPSLVVCPTCCAPIENVYPCWMSSMN